MTSMIPEQGLSLVQIYADWCGPCQEMHPIVDEIAGELGFPVVKLNLDENQEYAKRIGVSSIPAFLICKDGAALMGCLGYQTKDELKAWIDESLIHVESLAK